jgi:hypothetical protein
MKDSAFSISKKSLWVIIIYGTVLVLIILVVLAPLFLANGKIARSNEQLKSRIEEQKQLGPIYVSLLSDIKKKDLLVLPNPAPEKLARENTVRFKNDFRVIADKSRVKILSFSPDLSTLTDSSSSLLNHIRLKGEFDGFRKVLTGLGAIPYVEKIEEVEMRQNHDAMDLKMKVWIGLK